ncbi:MAG: Peptidase Imelysin, partial [Ilumatobacteraceae bacterium]|nr:Peptidase Imelysin [Ilumatobacteraceae bacterium]
DRSEVVGSLADDVAVPAFTELAQLAGALHASTEALCTEPTPAAVDATRTALAEARASWRRSEAVWVGPVMDRRSWSLIDWPVVPNEIEAMLADATIGPLDATYLSKSIGAALRGLGAIEYIVFGGGDDTPAALADPRRCQYLDGLTQVVADEADALLTLWTTGDGTTGPYRDELAGTTDQMSATDSVDALVNSMLSRLEGSVNRELGKSLGLGNGPADTTGIIEGPGGFGVADQAARADGVRLVLLGPDGTSGLSPLLHSDLRYRLASQFVTLDAALDAISAPLVAAVDSDPAAVQAAYDAYSALRVTVSTELVSALGVTVSFSDADGDSSG